MPWWDRDHRRWSREMRDVPLSQLRGNVDHDLFWQNPKKRRWAKRRLWWRENRGWVIGHGPYPAHRHRCNGRDLHQPVPDACTAVNQAPLWVKVVGWCS